MSTVALILCIIFTWMTYFVCFQSKEFEIRLKEKKPGTLTGDLRLALGMPVGVVSTANARDRLDFGECVDECLDLLIADCESAVYWPAADFVHVVFFGKFVVCLVIFML